MALSRQDVIDAALGILDEYGLADLTMRRLADNLQVQASALYWHVKNKQSLLAELVRCILDDLPEPSGPWRTGMASWAAQLRERLMRHRDSADLVASMRALGLAATDLDDGPAALLRTAGLSEQQASLASQTLVHLVLGHVYEEQQRVQLAPLTGADADEEAARAAGQDFDGGVQILLAGIASSFPTV